MKVINLTDLEKSEIKYKVSKFPDGQQNITIINIDGGRHNAMNGTGAFWISKEEIKIVSHLNNWLDLEIIIATVACLRELDVETIHLVVPYFVGARSDRKFEEGGNWYLKDVICPVINSMKFASVLVLDPHSWVLGNLITNFKYTDNIKVAKWALELIPNSITVHNMKEPGKELFHTFNCVFVSPDAGAIHKIAKVAEALHYYDDILTCTKERDTEGKLTKTNVPLKGKHVGKDFVIIDDICDGGRTFINIVKEIQAITIDAGYKPKFYLIVTHGIFSAGFEELSKYFDGIFCTNSYSTIGEFASNYGKLVKTNVEQLNVYE